MSRGRVSRINLRPLELTCFPILIRTDAVPPLAPCRVLLYGAEAGYTQLIDLALAQGADIDEVFRDGLQYGERGTAIERAATRGHANAVQTLVSHGASLEHKLDSWPHALHLAVKYGHLECVRILIDAGADPHGGYFDDPIALAVRKGDVAMLEVILQSKLEGFNINFRGSGGWALDCAISDDREDMARMLLKSGVNPEGLDYPSSKRSHLDEAVHKGALGIARALVEHGAQLRDAASASYSVPLECR